MNNTQNKREEETSLNDAKTESTAKKIIKRVAIGVGVVIVCAGGVLIFKNRETIMEWINALLDGTESRNMETDVDANSDAIKSVLDGMELTGELLTATEIGDLGGISAQKVNKRLIELGLADRYMVGVRATDLGKDFCEEIVTATSHNMSAYCKWDKAIVQLVLTPEEIANEAERKQRVAEIIAEYRNQAV